MTRMSNLLEPELLELENDWWDREDENDLSWLNEGEAIFFIHSKIQDMHISQSSRRFFLQIK
ncbi:hypothetical protein [Bacillus sp. MRMR6]|uniref:hypothetical protein n=1 Tax=Bacillus sp. MRMR6 TaxID=1928617 RepID=UPI0009532385|nr:hypothetical protein [Bacillus sp. MRMR6]OLS33872.1 hypothetical protein BTR25_23715 [Bacillus sp. MRMR6]